MTPAQWAELIDSYVAGRLSADSFKRRFLEAFNAAVQTRARVPNSVQDLAYVVEAYAGDPTARGHDVSDDEDLQRAATAALQALAPEAAAANPAAGAEIRIEQIDPEAARAEVRRAAFTVGAIGAAGCTLVLLYVGVGVLQLFAVAEQIQRVTDFGPVLATIGGLLLAFVPVLGGAIAFFGAVDGWGWPPIVAGLVFFAFPIGLLLTGFLQRQILFRGGPR